MLRGAKVGRKQARTVVPGCSVDERDRRLTVHRIRCLRVNRAAGLRLFVSRYQQFVRKIGVCIRDARVRADADHYPQAFKCRGLRIS